LIPSGVAVAVGSVMQTPSAVLSEAPDRASVLHGVEGEGDGKGAGEAGEGDGVGDGEGPGAGIGDPSHASPVHT